MKRFAMIVVLVAAGACASNPPPQVQPDPEVAAVRAVVDRLFDAMRASDSTALRSLFHADARLMTVGDRFGTPVLEQGPVDGFVTAVGTPHDRVYDERIWNVEIDVDGALAHAWMDYAFYLGDEFSHCGVNAFQFFRAPDGWKIIQITDTRRRDGCEMPPAADG